jgi:hypothetical protein
LEKAARVPIIGLPFDNLYRWVFGNHFKPDEFGNAFANEIRWHLILSG